MRNHFIAMFTSLHPLAEAIVCGAAIIGALVLMVFLRARTIPAAAASGGRASASAARRRRRRRTEAQRPMDDADRS